MEQKKNETAKEIMEGDDYAERRRKLVREINHVGRPPEEWKTDYNEFKKTQEEKDNLLAAKLNWRLQIQKRGLTKRRIPKAYISKSTKSF